MFVIGRNLFTADSGLFRWVTSFVYGVRNRQSLGKSYKAKGSTNSGRRETFHTCFGEDSSLLRRCDIFISQGWILTP